MDSIPALTHSAGFFEYLSLYFERSAALQSYWTLYVVIIAGLLAFASLRKEPAMLTTALVSVLFLCFAYKNLGAIHDVILQRTAILEVIESAAGDSRDSVARARILPTLIRTDYEGVRNFHLGCDVLTIAALGVMEVRRRKSKVAGFGPGA